ncbi:hypothetical protein OUZ56_019388 [Daphnia magna]|uniref:Peptidase S1 domain-containing protein n=1 Tax=Daphnia magna TaxID=35525 RepID=A0ABQ9ZC74_9CRUS|nr:hypothetical protein OUZ56_019388 [Daphnia magna]
MEHCRILIDGYIRITVWTRMFVEESSGVHKLVHDDSRCLRRDTSIVETHILSTLVDEAYTLLYLNGSLCGGSLIGSSHVLTAARCLYDHTLSEVSSFNVTVNQLSISGDGTGAVTRGVKNFIIHPNYNPNTQDNDVALLVLNAPIPNVTLVTLPSDTRASNVRAPTTTKTSIKPTVRTTNKPTTRTTTKPTTRMTTRTTTRTTTKPTTRTTAKPTTRTTTKPTTRTTAKPTTRTTTKPTTRTTTRATTKPTTRTTTKPTTRTTLVSSPPTTTTLESTTMTITIPSTTTTNPLCRANEEMADELTPLSDFYQTIRAFSPYANSPATATGWGTTSSGGNISQVLLKAFVTVLDNSVCSSQYGVRFIGTDMLCASAPGTVSCQGDIGGPLLVGGVQVGITSWGNGCADPNYAGVYTRVTTYLNWIKTAQASNP